MIKKLLFFFFFVLADCGYSYTKPETLSAQAWQEAELYLLPLNHPIKAKLDKLFKSKDATENKKNLKKSGFLGTKPGLWSHTIVTQHPKLKGYYFKLHTNDQKDIDSYTLLKTRVAGARSLQAAIDRHKYNKYFKVPKKWLYLVPNSSKFILVAEDCHLITEKGSQAKWKNTNDPKILTAFFTILQEEGLIDSVQCKNTAFSLDGELCFIDLEHHHQWPVPFNQLLPFLSSKMQKHWNDLINSL